MLNRLWICLNNTGRVICTMSGFPSHTGEVMYNPFYFQGTAFLPVETRQQDRRDGVYLSFGCNLRHGACVEGTPWAEHWAVLPHPRRKVQLLVPCHRRRGPKWSAECYMPKAFSFPYPKCIYTKWRHPSHEYIYNPNLLMQCVNQESKGRYEKGFNISRTKEVRASRRSNIIYEFSGSISII